MDTDPWLALRRELNTLCAQHGETEGIARFQEQIDTRARRQETRR